MDTLSHRAQAMVDLWLVSERLSSRVDHRLGAVHGIGFVELMVLLSLARAPERRMRRVDLALAIGRTASGVTRLLRPMEKIGLVARDSSDRDARVSLVTITATGETLLNDALVTLDHAAAKLLLPLGDATLDTLRAGLTLLREP
jgi:DNA-binding MarR family transcriptional regulator